INGELHVGTSIGLGGFGHMTMDPKGLTCTCGRRGCWETFASDRATLDRYRKLAKSKSRMTTVTELITLAGQRDAAALETLQVTARYLGEGIASLVHGLSPEVVVIGGEITGAWPIIGPIVEGCIKSNYIVPPISFKVRPSSVLRPSLFGAIPIALQHCFGGSGNKQTNSLKVPQTSISAIRRIPARLS
ncbi:MAG TPA: ROK family protein, partial [Pyrinomonadaceae bacterium]|nr:ROK family protein [Pyrinomonadaceae bacterium]